MSNATDNPTDKSLTAVSVEEFKEALTPEKIFALKIIYIAMIIGVVAMIFVFAIVKHSRSDLAPPGIDPIFSMANLAFMTACTVFSFVVPNFVLACGKTRGGSY